MEDSNDLGDFFVQKSTKQRAQYSFHIAVVTIIIRSFVEKIRNTDSDLGRRIPGGPSHPLCVDCLAMFQYSLITS